MAGMSTARVPAPDRGLNMAASPRALRSGEAVRLDNFLVRDSGKVDRRGGLRNKADVFGTTTASMSGFWAADGYVLVSGDVGSPGHVRMIGAGIDASNSPVTNLSLLENQYAQIDTNVWGRALHTPTSTYRLLKWIPGSPSYTFLANGPTAFIDVITWQRRLLVLSGNPAGGGTFQPFAIYWSDLGGPVVDAVASWQDDVSGLTNQRTFDGTGTALGFARCGSSIAILTTTGVYLLTGNADPASWSIRQISSTFAPAPASQAALAELATGFYFLSSSGYVYTDGVTFNVVSGPVAPYFRNATASSVMACAMADSSLLFTSPLGDLPTLVYNTRTDAWSTFTSLVTTHPQFGAHYAAGGFVFDLRYVWNSSALTAPERVAATNRHRDHNGGPTYTGPEFVWIAPPVDLASPLARVQLHRVIAEYEFYRAGVGVPTDAWMLTLYDDLLTTQLYQAQLPAQVTGTASVRLRQALDCFVEAGPVSVSMADTTGSDVTYTSLQDVYLEYQATSEATASLM